MVLSCFLVAEILNNFGFVLLLVLVLWFILINQKYTFYIVKTRWKRNYTALFVSFFFSSIIDNDFIL